MNGIAIAFVIFNASTLLLLPRRWAPLPILVGACYMPIEQAIELGPFHFSVIRLLIAAGLLRVIIRGERLAGRMNTIDWLMVVWATWALISSLFHKDISGTFVTHLGIIYNAVGVYFFLRIACQSLEDVVKLCRITAILLIPLSIEMLFEKMTGRNLFSALGGVLKLSEVRDGRIRAQGPFAHSILAGTAGGTCLPLMIGIWQQHRKIATIGVIACLIMVFTSTSSGPIMTTIFAIGALLMWYGRQRMQLFRRLLVLGYIGLDVVMKAPAYYIISRIDLTGSSMSGHRSALIDAAVKHFSEWWFAGSDYTRHWMDYGVGWSPDHIDVTNHYLRMGIDGGLPLMLLFIAILTKGFSFVGQILQQAANPLLLSRFMVWGLGASLFSHTASFFSVSYFDQSFVFLYLTLAAISSSSASFQTSRSAVSSRSRSSAIPVPTKPLLSVDSLIAKSEKNVLDWSLRRSRTQALPRSRYRPSS